MAEKLFPMRQRCKACGKGLGLRTEDPVYNGLYCTPVCAGIAALSSHAAHAPRECRTQREGHWVFKRKYRSEQEIPDKIRQDPSTNWYWCSHCHHLHIGHTRLGTAETFRMFVDPWTDLPDVLVKLRGRATRKQVAEVAGVRPIRLKELEEGTNHAEGLVTLVKVLGAYRVRLGVSLPSSTGSGPNSG